MNDNHKSSFGYRDQKNSNCFLDDGDASLVKLKDKNFKLDSAKSSDLIDKMISKTENLQIRSDLSKNLNVTNKDNDSTMKILNIVGKLKNILFMSVKNPFIFPKNENDKETKLKSMKNQLNKLINQDKIIMDQPPKISIDNIELKEESNQLNEFDNKLKLNLIFYEMDEVYSTVKNLKEYYTPVDGNERAKSNISQENNGNINLLNSNKRKEVYKRLFDICGDCMGEISFAIKKEKRKKTNLKQKGNQKSNRDKLSFKKSDKMDENGSSYLNSFALDNEVLLKQKLTANSQNNTKRNRRNTIISQHNDNNKHSKDTYSNHNIKSTDTKTKEYLTKTKNSASNLENGITKFDTKNSMFSNNSISNDNFSINKKKKFVNKSISIQKLSTSFINFDILHEKILEKKFENVKSHDFTIMQTKSKVKESIPQKINSQKKESFNIQLKSSSDEKTTLLNNLINDEETNFKRNLVNNRKQSCKSHSNISIISNSSRSVNINKKPKSLLGSKILNNKLKDNPFIRSLKKYETKFLENSIRKCDENKKKLVKNLDDSSDILSLEKNLNEKEDNHIISASRNSPINFIFNPTSEDISCFIHETSDDEDVKKLKLKPYISKFSITNVLLEENINKVPPQILNKDYFTFESNAPNKEFTSISQISSNLKSMEKGEIIPKDQISNDGNSSLLINNQSQNDFNDIRLKPRKISDKLKNEMIEKSKGKLSRFLQSSNTENLSSNNVIYTESKNISSIQDRPENVTARSNNYHYEINKLPSSRIQDVNKPSETNIKFKLVKEDFGNFLDLSLNSERKKNINNDIITIRNDQIYKTYQLKMQNRSKSNNLKNTSFEKSRILIRDS